MLLFEIDVSTIILPNKCSGDYYSAFFGARRSLYSIVFSEPTPGIDPACGKTHSDYRKYAPIFRRVPWPLLNQKFRRIYFPKIVYVFKTILTIYVDNKDKVSATVRDPPPQRYFLSRFFAVCLKNREPKTVAAVLRATNTRRGIGSFPIIAGFCDTSQKKCRFVAETHFHTYLCCFFW